ncbi:MAG: nuclear transport factor 2 family protein [Longimicrobiales bacterium]
MSKEALLTVFDRFRDALFACDTETLDALMAEGYRSYNLRGEEEDRNVVLAAYRPGGVTLTDFEVSELRIEVFSEVGVLTGRGFVAGTWEGQSWSHHLRFCDIYVAREGSWQILLSQATPMEEPARGP